MRLVKFVLDAEYSSPIAASMSRKWTADKANIRAVLFQTIRQSQAAHVMPFADLASCMGAKGDLYA